MWTFFAWCAKACILCVTFRAIDITIPRRISRISRSKYPDIVEVVVFLASSIIVTEGSIQTDRSTVIVCQAVSIVEQIGWARGLNTC
ncbi:MAG TPA: hypothetical protein DDW55_10100 [Gammaproteobacteria bacterium]|nr:hypothetical protein [Gammaproteobacteria bacterium]